MLTLLKMLRHTVYPRRVRGEPHPDEPIESLLKVYPRVCGGTCGVVRRIPEGWGLSPRVRGNPSWRPRFVGGRRSIPACAGEPGGPPTALACRRVYPRVCGGTTQLIFCTHEHQGLSPRVRGNRHPMSTVRPGVGSIPACAGEPGRCSQSLVQRAVYPRVCGGTTEGQLGLLTVAGLSPRVRGNQRQSVSPDRPSRSIPACAGEPTTASR